MQKKYVYTFPFILSPPFKQTLRLSLLQRGPNGVFGLAIGPVVDTMVRETPCSFFEIDLIKDHVSHTSTHLPYPGLIAMRVCYDWSRNAWAIAIDADSYRQPLDVYAILREDGMPWLPLFEAHSLDPEYHTEKAQIAFWQQGEYYPLVFCELDPTQMYDQDVRWTHWRPSQVEQPVYQYLGTSYRREPYLHDDGCLLFTFECVYDERMNRPKNQKMGTGHWQVGIAAYKTNGTVIHQGWVPGVTFAVRDLEIARSDLSKWLLFAMDVCDGPHDETEQQRTCVLAVSLQDTPERLNELNRKVTPVPDEREQAQGGLYCVNMHGQIVRHDPTFCGEQIRLCLCGDQVVGTSLQQGQRSLWSWRPFADTPHTIAAVFSPEVRRVTLVASSGPADAAHDVFWCVEEYDHGIRVVQRDCQNLQEVHALWCEGVRLPYWGYGYFFRDEKPQGVMAYQDTLLVLGMEQDGQLRLFQFQ